MRTTIFRRVALAAFALLSATLAVLASASSSPQESSASADSRDLKAVPVERRWALLIGINRYVNLEKPLDACVQDAQNMADALEKYAGFDPKHIVLMTFDVGDELDAGNPSTPTAENIRNRLNELVNRMTPNDFLLVSFSGHGALIDGKSYLCACDLDTNKLSSFVDREWAMDELERCRANRKLFLVDACRNEFEMSAEAKSRGGLLNAKSLTDPFEAGGKRRGFLQISSCAAGQKSLETGDAGVFTSSLLEGLRVAADERGELSILNWFDYAQQKTMERSRSILASRPDLGAKDQKIQEPTMSVSGELPRWVFADNLPFDGLTPQEWKDADALYYEACDLRKRRKYSSAQEKIAEALKLAAPAPAENRKKERYSLESERIELGRTQEEAAEARKLADEASLAYESKDYSTALTKIDSALKLVDSTAYRQLKKAIEEGLLGAGWEEDATRKAGTRKTLTVDGVEYAFCWCPAGTFKMGSPESEEGRDDDETQHTVRLSRGFWLLETEVTQAMWESVTEKNPSKFKGARLPVEMVSWNDCQSFLEKLNRSAPSGMKFSLPTEAQWEYACRAGTTGAYGGTGDLDEMGWYTENSGAKTHEVKTKKPNGWGLYDMHGNVREWCSDWFGDYPSGASTDPTGPSSAGSRVDRGGGWYGLPRYCRSACRRWSAPDSRLDDLGFRVVLSSK